MPKDKKQSPLTPRVHPSVFVAEGARIYGDVEISENASVWFNAVIRGDEGKVSIGRNTNIQDHVVVHSDFFIGTEIGDDVTVGHGAVIRGCRIGDNVMIGMHSTVMTGAEIGENSIVGANSLVPYGSTFPPRSLILGTPARKVRELTDEETRANAVAIQVYRDLIPRYRSRAVRGFTRTLKKGAARSVKESTGGSGRISEEKSRRRSGRNPGAKSGKTR